MQEGVIVGVGENDVGVVKRIVVFVLPGVFVGISVRGWFGGFGYRCWSGLLKWDFDCIRVRIDVCRAGCKGCCDFGF